jgi:hypothetical protein
MLSISGATFQTSELLSGDSNAGDLFLEGCSGFSVTGCHFEGIVNDNHSTAVELTRFRGHLTIWVGGLHDAEEVRTPRAVPA